MKSFAIFVGATVALLALIFGVLVVAGAVSIGNSKVNAEVAKRTANNRVETTIYDPQNVIANYQYFYNQCRAVQAKNQQLADADERIAALELRNQAEGNDPFGQGAQAIQDAITDRTGLKQSLASSAEEYNARSAQEATAAKFKAVNLPYRIETPYAVTCP